MIWIVETLCRYLTEFSEWLVRTYLHVFHYVNLLLDWLYKVFFHPVWQFVVSVVTTVWQFVVSIITPVWQFVTSVVTTVWQNVSAVVGHVLLAVGTMIEGIYLRVSDVVTRVVVAVVSFFG